MTIIQKISYAACFLLLCIFFTGCGITSSQDSLGDDAVPDYAKKEGVESKSLDVAQEISVLKKRVSDLEIRSIGNEPLHYPYTTTEDRELVEYDMVGGEISRTVIVGDLYSLGFELEDGEKLSLLSRPIGEKYFFVEFSVVDGRIIDGADMWSYDLGTKTVKKLRSPYRDWLFSINFTNLGLAFGAPDANGEIRELYLVDLYNDTEKVLTRLPSNQSFAAARTREGASITPDLYPWSLPVISVPVYSAAYPMPICDLEYLPDGEEFCTKRASIFTKEYNQGQ